MGCTIQFESHRGELAAIYHFEHDPAVLEFYDQPGPIKLVYPSAKGKPIGGLHTPDFFVLRADGCGWIECKMEDQLVQLAERLPHRYVRNADGSWHCPPGESDAQPLGFFTASSPRRRLIGCINAISASLKTICGPRVAWWSPRLRRPSGRWSCGNRHSRCLSCWKGSRSAPPMTSTCSSPPSTCTWTSHRRPLLIPSRCTSFWIVNRRQPPSSSASPLSSCARKRRRPV